MPPPRAVAPSHFLKNASPAKPIRERDWGTVPASRSRIGRALSHQAAKCEGATARGGGRRHSVINFGS